MEIYERIRLLRKDHLKLSQNEFGEMLGVNRSNINNIEGNRLVKPEQKEPLYRLICKTFNVRYEWLMTGDGEIFVTTPKSLVEKLSEEYNLSITAQKIIESYLNLDENQRTTVDSFIKSIAESVVSSRGETSGAVDEAIDKTMSVYFAANSKGHKEPKIIKDGKGLVEDLSKIPPVTDKKDF